MYMVIYVIVDAIPDPFRAPALAVQRSTPTGRNSAIGVK